MTQSNTLVKFISCIETAIVACSRYSGDHDIVNASAAKAVALLPDIMVDHLLTINLSEGGLKSNDALVTVQGYHTGAFMSRLRKKKIGKIIFSQDADFGAFRAFIANMASRNPVVSRPGITVGIVENKPLSSARTSAEIVEANITKLGAIFLAISASSPFDKPGLMEKMSVFILILQRQINV